MRKHGVRMDRRAALAVAGAGIVALGSPRNAVAQAAQLTTLERANIKIVDDFIAAWNARDGAKAMAFFAPDARFSVGPAGRTRPWSKPDFAELINTAQRLKMTITPGTTWARGPVVTHERRDDIIAANGQDLSGLLIGIFTLKDSKIVDFLDVSSRSSQ